MFLFFKVNQLNVKKGLLKKNRTNKTINNNNKNNNKNIITVNTVLLNGFSFLQKMLTCVLRVLDFP